MSPSLAEIVSSGKTRWRIDFSALIRGGVNPFNDAVKTGA